MALTKVSYSMISNGYINVKDYGAVGDGATDDTDAIKAAVAAGLASKANAPGYGENNGTTVFFPIGKYRISDAIGIYEGCNLLGEQSGLTNSGAGLSTGAILLLSNTKPNGSAWTSTTLVGGNTINKRVMFTVVDGGPIEMQNLGAITESNNSSDSVFYLSNNGFNVPYENTGTSQALFRGMRIFAFGEVFRGCRFADVTIDNCGFEYNITVFSVVPKYGNNQGSFGGINSIATQYFSNYQTVAVGDYCSFSDNQFSSCYFSGAINSNGSIFVGSGTTNCDFSNNHFAACDFSPDTNNTGAVFAIIANGFVIQTNTFASCRIKNMPLTAGGYQPPGSDQFLGNVFTGNVFESCPVNLNNYENDANVFVGNTFKGASYIQHYGGTLTFVGNSFDLCTYSGNDFTVQDTAGLLCVGNYFRANKQSINYTTVSEYKVTSNINLLSKVSVSYTTVTAGGGGWSNGSPTPQAVVDESGFVHYKGIVTNSGVPALNSVMCSAPSGMVPKYDVWYVLPSTNSSTDYAIANFGADGNLYFQAQTGTAQSFNLAPIVYQAA